MEKNLLKLIKKQKVAFIASIDENGNPNIKAMNAPRKIEGNTFYFSTNTSSKRVQQFFKNPQASIYFYKRGKIHYKGVMLVGTMEVLTDEKTKKEIWHFGDTLFYKKGVTDPDYCVLKFTAKTCRWYSDLKTDEFEL
ncbi:MAG: pyridoxamine 5'-phosphate oxidase family protein [Anaeroplasmataceae bacterium]|nr:pyridoxamine 5'-phosphate oxidase family protein [Anaeroplasmataceae bacterium]